jgi:hypothetical protein
MRSLTKSIQWTVVFFVLTAGGWLAFPEFDPLGGSSGVLLLHQLKEDALKVQKSTPHERDAREIASLLTAIP